MSKNLKYIWILVVAIAVGVGVWSFWTPPANTDGIWRGHFDINGRGNFDFTTLSVDGNLIAFSDDARMSYQGSVRLKGGQYHSDMNMFFLNGSPFDTLVMDGTFDPQKIVAQFLTRKAKDKGTLTLTRDTKAFEKGASIERIEGEWILYKGFMITKFSIDGKGDIHGADTNGCSYDGVVTLVNKAYNAYNFDLLMSSCDNFDGEFSGMGFVSSSIAEDDTLHIQIVNDNWGIYLPITRDKPAKAKDKESQT